MALISSSLGLTGKDAVTFLSRYRCVDPLADEALSAPRPGSYFLWQEPVPVNNVNC